MKSREINIVLLDYFLERQSIVILVVKLIKEEVVYGFFIER